MEILRPDTLSEALEMKAAHPGARPIAGGTDLMVELNFDRTRPEQIIDLARVPELAEHGRTNGTLRIGAGVSYTRLITELGDVLPGLAIASRTVGSPQIRKRGTLGGNLATASPAGDALPQRCTGVTCASTLATASRPADARPPLWVADAVVEVESARGARSVAVREF